MVGKKKIVLYRCLGVAILAAFALLHSLDKVGMSGNETSRLATIQAVSEQNTFAIERTDFRTVDKVFFNGHLYSDKPPFMAFVIGAALKPVQAATGWSFREDREKSDKPPFMAFVIGTALKLVQAATGRSFREDREKLVYLINFLLGGSVNILLFWWLFNMFRRVRRGSVEAKFLLALGSVAGSWLLSYSVVINNHTPAALCALGAYVALWKFSRKPTFRAAALAGLACGVMGAVDIPGGVVFGLALIPALALSSPRGRRAEYVLAAACVVAFSALCVFALNYAAYRRPLPLYLGQGGSYQPGTHSKSFFGYAAECLFTWRGIFSYQPFLLLAFPALWFCRKGLRAAERTIFAATLVYSAFYIVLTNEFGGAAYGFRYLIPVIPVWSFLAGMWVLSVRKKAAKVCLGALSAVLLLWGVVTSAVGAYFPFCFAFEGFRTPPGHFSRSVRSTFGGNLLCWSFEHYPDSSLTRHLIRHYGERPALEHLFWSFVNMEYLDLRAIRGYYAERGVRDFNRYYLSRMTDEELAAWLRIGRLRRVEKAAK